ncbi:hypothetical protein Tco_1499839 [Tanacetum coccineum]
MAGKKVVIKAHTNASKQERRIHDIDADEDITLVNDDKEMFDVGTLTGDKVLAEQVVVAKDMNLSVDEVTLAQAFAALKSAKDSAATTTTVIIPTPRTSQENVQDKGKGKMVEPKKPMKKKELIRLDQEIASKLQAEFDEEVRLAREKAKKEQEANVALTEEWDDIQAKIEKRRKHFAAKRAEEKRNKLPTQAQQRKIICTYLKNMEGKKPKDLMNKSFDSIQKMFDKAFKRVNTFVDFRTYLVEGSSKMYLVLSHMLKSFDREELETLYKLVKAKYRLTRRLEDLDLVLYGDLKTIFEPHVEDNVWKNQSNYRVLDWKLYDS